MLEITKKNARQWSRLGPRAVYGMAIYNLVESNDRVYAMSADLGGSSGLKRLIGTYPDRYLNVGIAEQNLIGVAAGLAKEGLIPYASSFAPFITMRCADQIRMNMGYMHLNIKAVGLGSGVSMGYLGNSHYGVEDIAVMRAIPGMTILSPADCGELVKCVYAAAKHDGPVYIRLTGEPGMPVVYKDEFDFSIGHGRILRQGDGVAIIATGSMVDQAVKVAEALSENNINATVVDMCTVKPLDEDLLAGLADTHNIIFTVEEHSVINGMGASISQFYSKTKIRPQVINLGLPDVYFKCGDYQYMLDKCGLSVQNIISVILKYV